MRIAKNSLANIVRNILNEGKAEDLVSQHPQLKIAYDRGVKKEAHLRWLIRMEKFEPIRDIFPLIFALEKNKQRLAVKDINSYHNPNDLRCALESLGDSRSKQKKQISDNETDIVYQDEQWTVVVPLTQESSIQWGKGTTWCTAATNSENLFYDYVFDKHGSYGGYVILFYVIKNDGNSRENPYDKMSIGFVNGEIDDSAKYGGLSVNAQNKGIDSEDLRGIVREKYESIMSSMEKYAKKNDGFHPILRKIHKIVESDSAEEASLFMGKQNRESFKRLFNIFCEVINDVSRNANVISYFAKSIKDESMIDRIVEIISNGERDVYDNDKSRAIIEDAISYIFINHPNFKKSRSLCLLSPFLKSEILENVSKSTQTTNADILRISRNTNCNEETLRGLFDRVNSIASIVDFTDDEFYQMGHRSKESIDRITFLECLVNNSATPIDVIEKISKYDLSEPKMFHVLGGIVKNPKTPQDFLEKTIDRLRDLYDRLGEAQKNSQRNFLLNQISCNTSLTMIQFAKIMWIDSMQANINIAKNRGCPDEILLVLAKSEIKKDRKFTVGMSWDSVNFQIACNPNASSETLDFLAKNDMSDTIRGIVALHDNTSIQTLRYLHDLGVSEINEYVEENQKWKNVMSSAQISERWQRLLNIKRV